MITKSIQRAYDVMAARNWDTIYWAIDLHGVCFASTYSKGNYQFINDDCLVALKLISSKPENRLILWSSCYPEEYQPIINFFKAHDIPILGFNENPLEKNTHSGCFDTKFYFSILLDDKAGFDPAVDWQNIIEFYKRR
jgi:hypothetical protein